MNAFASVSIPTSEAVECMDCHVVFSSRNGSCPKCAAVIGIVPVETNAPAKEIARLRDREAWTTAALLQIAHGLHDAGFKKRVAIKALDFLKEKAPASTSADEPRKEQIQ